MDLLQLALDDGVRPSTSAAASEMEQEFPPTWGRGRWQGDRLGTDSVRDQKLSGRRWRADGTLVACHGRHGWDGGGSGSAWGEDEAIAADVVDDGKDRGQWREQRRFQASLMRYMTGG
jgi:hypothetical protein